MREVIKKVYLQTGYHPEAIVAGLRVVWPWLPDMTLCPVCNDVILNDGSHQACCGSPA